MTSKLFIGNLNYSTTDERLRDAFASCGEVLSAVVVRDRYSNQSKGFGFVEMAEEPDAEAAIAAWNGKELDGRRLRVNHAEDKPRGGRRPEGGGYAGYGGRG